MSDGGGPGRVIVVGSVNVDLVLRLPRLPAPGETVLGGAAARHHGGKGANQAVAAARAGALVHLVSAVGAADGTDSLDALLAEGIDVTGVAVTSAPTGIAVVLVDTGSGENQIAVAAGANDEVTGVLVRESLSALSPGPADVVLLSFEIRHEPLRAAADLAAAAGARLVVNPAPARAGYADLLPGAIVTPNGTELAELGTQLGLSPDLGPPAAARALAAHTGRRVIVTMGAEGALLARPEETEVVPAHPVLAVDTTGAGDTLTGVLAASLAQGYELRAGLRRAMAAAALTVTRPGARGGMPTAAAIDELLAGVADYQA
jgi:ribokinase